MTDEEGMPLTELLNDEPAEVFEEAPAPIEEAPTGPVRDEQGRFASTKGVEEGVPPTQLPPNEYKAIREEREKRQALERELEALRAQQNPPEPPPSIWEDDQGALNHVKNEAVATAVQQATFNAKLDMSEMMVRQANPDFDEVKAEFLALAAENPVLRQQALADPHPWNKAYQIAKNHRAMQELGATDLDTLKAKLREELMAEMRAQAPARPGLPPTLTTERSVASRGGPAWTGPSSLQELLG